MKNTNARPYRLCGLLAENPSTLSEAMHEAAYKDLEVDQRFMAFHVNDVEAAIAAMRNMKFCGYSVTIPFKERVIPLLDALSPEAKEIAAVNTIVNKEDVLTGYNTDWIGVREAIKEKKLSNISSALVIGSGGAAKAAAYTLCSLNIPKIDMCNRTRSKAENINQHFSLNEVHAFEDLPSYIGTYDLVINSTPITEFATLSEQSFSATQCVFDMITYTTPMLEYAERAGAEIIPGLRMILHQAVEQVELFTGKRPSVDVMEKALYGVVG